MNPMRIAKHNYVNKNYIKYERLIQLHFAYLSNRYNIKNYLYTQYRKNVMKS